MFVSKSGQTKTKHCHRKTFADYNQVLILPVMQLWFLIFFRPILELCHSFKRFIYCLHVVNYHFFLIYSVQTSSFFWDVTRLLMILEIYRSHLQRLGNILGLTDGCPETSATKYRPTPRHIPEERRPELRRGEGMKSRRYTNIRKAVSWSHEVCQNNAVQLEGFVHPCHGDSWLSVRAYCI